MVLAAKSLFGLYKNGNGSQPLAQPQSESELLAESVGFTQSEPLAQPRSAAGPAGYRHAYGSDFIFRFRYNGIVMAQKTYIRGIINGGLAAAVAGLAWIFGPSLWLEVGYQIRPKQAKVEGSDPSIIVSAGPISGFAGMFYSVGQGFSQLSETAQVLITPLSTEFGVVIPKILANVAVTPNVNPSDTNIYQSVLRQSGGVAHAAGSALPNEDGAVYIFGHSTDSNLNVARFNAVFYLLRKLEADDLILVYYQGEEYRYRVKYKKVADPTDLSDITDVSSPRRLVLQTCWPPGTTWKRLLIVAEPETV